MTGARGWRSFLTETAVPRPGLGQGTKDCLLESESGAAWCQAACRGLETLPEPRPCIIGMFVPGNTRSSATGLPGPENSRPRRRGQTRSPFSVRLAAPRAGRLGLSSGMVFDPSLWNRSRFSHLRIEGCQQAQQSCRGRGRGGHQRAPRLTEVATPTRMTPSVAACIYKEGAGIARPCNSPGRSISTFSTNASCVLGWQWHQTPGFAQGDVLRLHNLAPLGVLSVTQERVAWAWLPANQRARVGIAKQRPTAL